MESLEISETNFKDKSTDIQELVKSFELRLSGWITSYSANGYIYTGDCLCGQSAIQQLVGLLDAFAKKGNLISSKKEVTFFKQRYLNSSVMNGVLLTNETVPAKNYITIGTMFRTVLQNIGDIILQSKGLMQTVLGGETPLTNKMDV